MIGINPADKIMPSCLALDLQLPAISRQALNLYKTGFSGIIYMNYKSDSGVKARPNAVFYPNLASLANGQVMEGNHGFPAMATKSLIVKCCI